MLSADGAKTILPQRKDQIAEIACIEKRTPLTVTEAKMRYLVPLDGCRETLTDVSCHQCVAFGRFFIDIDLPTNATIVSASVGNASKAFIIIGIYSFHSFNS